MNDPKERHFEHDNIDALKFINGVSFTVREINIMACLLNARGTSRIALLLDISPRTVENHIRNLMVKLGCNSREGIIDFIEKYNAQPTLRNHYAHLLLEQAFKDALKGIAKQISKTVPYSLVYWIEQKDNYLLLKKFKKDLELANLTIHLEKREDPLSITKLIDEAQTEKYAIYLIPKVWDDVKNMNFFGKRTLSPGQTSSNVLFLFLENRKVVNIPPTIGNVKCIDFSKSENYYFSIFEILKVLFPHINLEHKINDFKNRHHLTEASFTARSTVDFQQLIPPVPLKNHIFSGRRGTVYLLLAVALVIFSMGIHAFMGKKERQDQDIVSTAKQTEHPIRSDLPIPNNAILLNRSELIKQLNEKFQRQSAIQTVALVGLGGAGKTTLARQYVHQQKANVIWEINAETSGSLYGSFEKLAHVVSEIENDQKILRGLLELKNTTEKNEKLVTFVKRRLKQRSPWFLIFDNVEHFSDIQKAFPRDIETWGEGKVILTTRNTNIQNSYLINHVISIGELTSKQKKMLFTKVMGCKKFHTNESGAILAFLDHIPPFPLDVSVAAYYLKSTNIPYAQYIEKLNNYTKEMDELHENILKETGEYTKTRYAIITYSLEHLIKNHKDFADLLLYISLLDSQNIPKSLLDQYKTPSTIDNFIYHLTKHSMLTTNILPPSGETAYSIHRSIQAIILNFFRTSARLEKATIFQITNALETYIDKAIDEEDFSKIKVLVGHTNAFLSHSVIFSDEIKGTIAGKLGLMCFHVGDCPDAQHNLELSLAHLNKNRTKNLDKISHVLGYLGSVYKDVGNYEKAKLFLNESLSIYRNKARNDDPLISWTLIYLGNVYRSLGDYKKARDLYAETLATQRAFYGDKHPKTVWSLVCLAHSYMQLGDYKKTKDLMEKGLAIYQKHFSTEHPGSAWIAVYVGRMYNILGQPKNAEKLLKEALKIHLKHYGNKHIKTAWCFRHLGHTFAILGNFQDAKIMLEYSLKIYKQHYGEDHYKFASVLLRLGAVYREMGDYKKSKDMLKQTLKVYNKHYKKDHIEIARILRELAQVYILEGNLHIGENLSQKALLISKQNKDPEAFIPLEILAGLFLKKPQKSIYETHYNAKDNEEKAKNYLKQALEIVNTHFPVDSSHILRIQSKIKILEEKGKKKTENSRVFYKQDSPQVTSPYPFASNAPVPAPPAAG